MYLKDLPLVLTWQASSSILDSLHTNYIEFLMKRLRQLTSRVKMPRDCDLDAYVSTLLGELSEDECGALLCEPEVSYRLLWPTHHVDVEAANFLCDVLRDHGRPVTADRGCVASLPVDVASTLARTVDVTGTQPRLFTPGPLLNPSVLPEVFAKLEVAVAAIRTGVPRAWRVVEGFTKLLHLLPDNESPGQFSSGSSGQFVGRTVIANAHLSKITPVEIAEALVHEAIHSVLYMDEQQSAWVLDESLYAGPARIRSPWTSNPLPLRPYLQACFVWYGLVAFWSEALSTCMLDRKRAKGRFEAALAGFLRGDLLSRVAAFSGSLSTEVQGAVSDMQGRVLTCMPTDS